jgi:hypothetical protein
MGLLCQRFASAVLRHRGHALMGLLLHSHGNHPVPLPSNSLLQDDSSVHGAVEQAGKRLAEACPCLLLHVD